MPVDIFELPIPIPTHPCHLPLHKKTRNIVFCPPLDGCILCLVYFIQHRVEKLQFFPWPLFLVTTIGLIQSAHIS